MADTFELRSLPDERGKARLFLLQLPYKTKYVAEVEEFVTRGLIDGATLDVAKGAIMGLLREADVRIPGGASRPAGEGAAPVEQGDWTEQEFTVKVDEELAIRLSIIFNAINSLRSEEKIQTIIEGIAAMSMNNAQLWMSMMAENADGARKALTVYLTEE